MKIIKKTTSAKLPTAFGVFNIHIFRSLDKREHAVLVKGSLKKEPVLTRIHSQCLTGDTLLSLKCDCREQLQKSMRMIQKKGSGIILYLNQEGRGIGLTGKIKAYGLQERGLDTVEANKALHLPIDAREYKIAAQILHDLGVKQITILTNNPAKIKQLEQHGIRIAKRIPLEARVTKKNKSYLLAKKRKLGHILTIHE